MHDWINKYINKYPADKYRNVMENSNLMEKDRVGEFDADRWIMAY